MVKQQLEHKHIIPYLNYGLNVLNVDVVFDIEGVDLHQKDRIIAERTTYLLRDIVPILRPLSDLDKVIEYKGERFNPLDRIKIYNTSIYLIHQIRSGLVEVIVWNMLLEWGFDVFGLIDIDLAVDWNSIYKK